MKDSIKWFMQKCAQSSGNDLWDLQRSQLEPDRRHNNGIPLPDRLKLDPKWKGPYFPGIGELPETKQTGPDDDDDWKSWKKYEEEQRYKQWKKWREEREREQPSRPGFPTDPLKHRPIIPHDPNILNFIKTRSPSHYRPIRQVLPNITPIFKYMKRPTRVAIGPNMITL